MKEKMRHTNSMRSQAEKKWGGRPSIWSAFLKVVHRARTISACDWNLPILSDTDLFVHKLDIWIMNFIGWQGNQSESVGLSRLAPGHLHSQLLTHSLDTRTMVISPIQLKTHFVKVAPYTIPSIRSMMPWLQGAASQRQRTAWVVESRLHPQKQFWPHQSKILPWNCSIPRLRLNLRSYIRLLVCSPRLG
jgi:hypothetical protein